MPRYVLRYFFDPGSNICLWSANDAAREQFDYPVCLHDLGLPENLERRVIYLMAWFDTSLDWEYPPNPSPWTETERTRFREASQHLLSLLREQLGSEFEIIDESTTPNS